MSNGARAGLRVVIRRWPAFVVAIGTGLGDRTRPEGCRADRQLGIGARPVRRCRRDGVFEHACGGGGAVGDGVGADTAQAKPRALLPLLFNAMWVKPVRKARVPRGIVSRSNRPNKAATAAPTTPTTINQNDAFTKTWGSRPQAEVDA
jgi:hypothetical protein